MSYLHKTHNRLIRYFGLVTIAVFGIISTLGTGGGGGDDGGGGVTPVTYTGLMTQAVITSNNALPLGEVAFLGVSAGTAITPVAVQSAPLAETRNASVITITRVLHDKLNNMAINSTLSSLPVGWIETVSEVGNCTVPGTFSGSLDVNETTMTVSGSMVFDDFCFTILPPDPAYGLTMDGTITFTGTCDPVSFDVGSQTCDLTDYIMTFTTFNTRGFGESQTMTGTIASVLSATGYEAELDLLLRDDTANVTYKFKDYIITVTENSPSFGYDSVEVLGNVYHPVYGFVVVSTLTPVQFYSDSLDSPPLTGVVLLTGAIPAGAAGPTTATFTFIDFDNYTLEVDTNGDGAPDVILNCTWSTDICA